MDSNVTTQQLSTLPEGAGPVVVASTGKDDGIFDAIPAHHPDHPAKKNVGVLGMCCSSGGNRSSAAGSLHPVGHGKGDYIPITETRTRYKYVGNGFGNHEMRGVDEHHSGGGCCHKFMCCVCCLFFCLLGLAVAGGVLWGLYLRDHVEVKMIVTEVEAEKLFRDSETLEKFKEEMQRAIAAETDELAGPEDVEVTVKAVPAEANEKYSKYTRVWATIMPAIRTSTNGFRFNMDLEGVAKALLESKPKYESIPRSLRDGIGKLKEMCDDWESICLVEFTATVVEPLKDFWKRVMNEQSNKTTVTVSPAPSSCQAASTSAAITNGHLRPVATTSAPSTSGNTSIV